MVTRDACAEPEQMQGNRVLVLREGRRGGPRKLQGRGFLEMPRGRGQTVGPGGLLGENSQGVVLGKLAVLGEIGTRCRGNLADSLVGRHSRCPPEPVAVQV